MHVSVKDSGPVWETAYHRGGWIEKNIDVRQEKGSSDGLTTQRQLDWGTFDCITPELVGWPACKSKELFWRRSLYITIRREYERQNAKAGQLTRIQQIVLPPLATFRGTFVDSIWPPKKYNLSTMHVFVAWTA